MVFWIPIAMAAASAIGQGVGNMRAKKRRNKRAGAISAAGGLDQYNPALGASLDAMGNPTEGPAASMQSIARGFQGTDQQLEIEMRRQAPFIAGSLANTGAFKHMQDFKNFDMVKPEEHMQPFGSMAAAGAKSAARTGKAQRSMLARSGMGNSAAMGALAGQQSLGLQSNQADLYSRLYQNSLAQRQQNTMLQAQWANQAFDMQRAMTQMALGAVPSARQQEQKVDQWGPIMQMAGSALGNFLGGSGGKGSGSDGGAQSREMDEMRRANP